MPGLSEYFIYSELVLSLSKEIPLSPPFLTLGVFPTFIVTLSVTIGVINRYNPAVKNLYLLLGPFCLITHLCHG